MQATTHEAAMNISRIALRPVPDLPVLWIALALLAATVCATAARAQDYPSRPVHIVVPYAPGGAGDVIARIVAQRLATDLAVSVVVDNKPGGSGMIGAASVAKAAPDGHTILLGNTTEMAVAPYIVKTASYETQRDFIPVAFAGALPQLLIATPAAKVKTIGELIAAAKARPNEFSYATAGSGSAAHIAGALLEKLAGIRMLRVPYKGGAQAVTDVLSGNVSIYFSGIPPAIGHVKTGKLVALGIASTKPVSSLPGIPALATGALTRLDLSPWFGFFVPRDTPPATVAMLNTRIRAILDAPDIRARLVDLGVEPASMSAPQFDSFVQAERKKYLELVTELAVEPD